VGLEIIPIRDFGLGRKLVALWDGDVHVGQLEYRGVAGKITEIYALGGKAGSAAQGLCTQNPE
jgi:hypothetical protein